jgi:hypothetical protein
MCDVDDVVISIEKMEFVPSGNYSSSVRDEPDLRLGTPASPRNRKHVPRELVERCARHKRR